MKGRVEDDNLFKSFFITKAVQEIQIEKDRLKNLIEKETFEKCSILAKIKKGENLNRRNIGNISRIEI
jgi:hypothetical protein